MDPVEVAQQHDLGGEFSVIWSSDLARMAARYYSPRISRLLVCALYHEAKARRQPMTALVNDLLTLSLRPTPSYALAQKQGTNRNPQRGITE